MIDSAQLLPLRERRAQIAKRIGDLEARADKIAREKADLSKEAAAIDTTLETLSKIYGVELGDAEERPSRGLASTKPDKTPTMYDMVDIILSESTVQGREFLEAQTIYDEIRRRWWPEAPRNSVIPSLYRFEKEGRLVKFGTKYGLPSMNEALGGQTPSASESEWSIEDDSF